MPASLSVVTHRCLKSGSRSPNAADTKTPPPAMEAQHRPRRPRPRLPTRRPRLLNLQHPPGRPPPLTWPAHLRARGLLRTALIGKPLRPSAPLSPGGAHALLAIGRCALRLRPALRRRLLLARPDRRVLSLAHRPEAHGGRCAPVCAAAWRLQRCESLLCCRVAALPAGRGGARAVAPLRGVYGARPPRLLLGSGFFLFILVLFFKVPILLAPIVFQPLRAYDGGCWLWTAPSSYAIPLSE